MTDPPLVFVTPWYGPEVPGGAEALARHTAERLHQAGYDVSVMTTCLRDLYADWNDNYHRPGVTTINGVPVHRFPVEAADRAAFDAVNARLIHGRPVDAAAERAYVEEMFRAPALYEAIAARDDALFFFIPYLFATTVFGAQIHPQRSIVIPCLHDEAYARLGVHRRVIPAARGLVFNTAAEQRLAHRLFGRRPGRLEAVIGMGVEEQFAPDAARFRECYGVEEPFLLYAGRREVGKNTPLLLDYWGHYAAGRGPGAKLVLLGPNEVPIPAAAQPHVVDVGFVPAQDKWDAYAAATALCQPSLHESFSIVLLESWLAGTPALVHGGCAVTREHAQRGNGGLYFLTYEEFAAALDLYFARPALAARLGQQGRRYVQANFRWDVIVDKYRRLIAAAAPRRRRERV